MVKFNIFNYQINGELIYLRSVLLLGALGLTFFGLVLKWENPDFIDPLIIRIVLSTISFSILAFGYYNTYINKHTYSLSITLFYVVTAYITFLTYLNNFTLEYVALIIIAILIITSVFRIRSHYISYILFTLIFFTVLLAISTDLTNSKFFLLTVFGFFMGMLYLIGVLKISVMRVMESATKAKTEFLATMSHEIRTPMNAVIGMTGILEQTPLSADQKSYVDTIKLGGENLLTIINNILDFSKIESGKLELEEYEFNLSESIEEVLDLAYSTANEKGIELLYFVDKNVPKNVKGDVTRLRQILMNLVGNGLKFTTKGELVVTAKLAENQDYNNNGYHSLQFTVKDSGIGIPKNKIGLLFKSFSQVDSSTTRKYGGTGLGLAICKKLVNLMGGNIWVESEEGVGTQFHFTIQLQGKPVAPFVNKQLENKNALLITSNPRGLDILEYDCKNWGLQVEKFTSATAALIALQTTKHFDVVILDTSIRCANGSSLIQTIRKDKPLTNLPIIGLGTLNTADKEADNNLFSDVISKPISKPVLLNMLNSVLDNKTYIRANSAAVKHFNPIALSEKTGSLRLLLVEDNLVNQKVAIQMFKRLGYTADIAANGIEALSALELKTYDLIFMDVQMPEMDGMEATRQIRLKYANNKPMIIVGMTANAMKGDRENCLKAGMDDYLSKPVRLNEISQVIQKWFSNKLVEKRA